MSHLTSTGDVARRRWLSVNLLLQHLNLKRQALLLSLKISHGPCQLIYLRLQRQAFDLVSMCFLLCIGELALVYPLFLVELAGKPFVELVKLDDRIVSIDARLLKLRAEAGELVLALSVAVVELGLKRLNTTLLFDHLNLLVRQTGC
jgi:hypothetical protein